MGTSGGAWDQKTFTSQAVDHFGLPGIDLGSSNDSAFLGGLQLGYNYQFAPNWLIGIEGTWSWTGLDNASNQLADTVFTTEFVSTSAKVNQIWTVTGRLGYIVNPALLVYVNGGFADGHFKATTFDSFPAAHLQHTGDSSGWKGGWTVGAGADYRLASNWLVGLDYKYYDLGDYYHSGTVVSVDGSGIGAPTTFDERVETRIHSLALRLSYLFNSGQ